MGNLNKKEEQCRLELRTKLAIYPPVLRVYASSLVEHGKSYATVNAYIKTITYFLDTRFGYPIPENFYLLITADDIKATLASLPSNASRAIRWTALNSLFQFLVPQYAKLNPLENIPRPLVEQADEMIYLTNAEIIHFFDNADRLAQDEYRNRDLAILMLGLICGLKISTIAKLDVSDVDLRNNVLHIRGQNIATDYLPFGHKIHYQLECWLQDREENFGQLATRALFVSKLKTRISEDIINAILAKYSEGLEKRVTSQVLRNTCALNLYKQTGDIQLCASYLNHNNVASTQRYIVQLKSGKTLKDAALIMENLFASTVNNSTKGMGVRRSEMNQDLLDLFELHGIGMEMLHPMLHFVADLLVLKAEKAYETEEDPLQTYTIARKAAQQVRTLETFVDNLIDEP